MNKVKFLIAMMLVALTLSACSKEDNPVDSKVVLDNPQEVVTDQPAFSR
jgi:PBP1b-binding outer membrane lipoprotein LpoB